MSHTTATLMRREQPMRPLISRLRRRERGQALVEFAIFVVILANLIAGVVDIGGLLGGHVGIVFAARQGARTAAVLGNLGKADCATVGAIQAAVANLPGITLNTIIIYKAGVTGLPINGTTRDVYQGNAQCDPTTAVITPAATLSGYLPNQRNNQPLLEDSIGVELDYTYAFPLPFLPIGAVSTISLVDRTVMPINPTGVASPQPTATTVKP
ncbi:MAG: TadE/TadG family type IV pilus assembly protein [Ktedonobacterales bacterium]